MDGDAASWRNRVGDGVGFEDGVVTEKWIRKVKAERKLQVVGKGESARRLKTAANQTGQRRTAKSRKVKSPKPPSPWPINRSGTRKSWFGRTKICPLS